MAAGRHILEYNLDYNCSVEWR